MSSPHLLIRTEVKFPIAAAMTNDGSFFEKILVSKPYFFHPFLPVESFKLYLILNAIEPAAQKKHLLSEPAGVSHVVRCLSA